ncbi:hypothetical protein ABI_22460 [Asticcacaulis biprosthecium C19]|uniref:Uncharacterized protein n=1 Tax=Asticcacaulis biprosthecium C19 TaxID=715226 RepID=F4QNC7_9CAUL|nr:hypothetical protein [Asticcacaulis biprosthecium]EGF90835.1 hypothetical protein ABI_22460 [Asticcacaulis biprosthecium C19]
MPSAKWDDIWPTHAETDLVYENVPVRFHIAARGQSWEVFRDTCFWGIFRSRTEAQECVRDAMQQIFCGGGSAQVRFA